MAMLLLKRSGVPLDRDVIFLAESGEEADTAGVGINFMVSEHFDEIDAEFALAEGGGATLEGGRVTQGQHRDDREGPARGSGWSQRAPSGHGSVPRLDNPLVHLAAAVAKVGTWETPMRLNETTRAYFEQARARSARRKPLSATAQLLDPQPPRALQRYFAEHEPRHYSMLRTSVVPTMLKAGVGPNVIPSEAEATLRHPRAARRGHRAVLRGDDARSSATRR